MKVLLFLLFLLGNPPSPLWSDPSFPYQDLPIDLPSHFGVIGVRPTAAAPDTVEIAKVHLRGPAARAGVRPGDRLIAIPPYRIRTPDELSRCIQSFLPDTEITLVIQRQDEILELPCTVTDVRRLYFLMGEQELTTDRIEQFRHRDWSTLSDSLETTAQALIQSQDAEGDFDDLLAALSTETERYAGDCRLQDVHYALRHPLKGTQIAAGLTAGFSFPITLDSFLATIASHLDLEPMPAPAKTPTPLHEQLDPAHASFVDHLLVPFFGAALQATQAFAPLSPDEHRDLFSGIPYLLKRFGESFYLDDGDSTETATHLRTLQLAKEVDLNALFAAARIMAPLTEADELDKIRKLTRHLDGPIDASLPPTFGGKFLYARRTSAGWVLIGDKGANYYGEDAALIVDLGGNDTYFNNCAAPLFTIADDRRELLSPVALIIDYDGDDRYIGNATGSIGAAIGGVGLLLDLKGDDLYQGNDLTQGAAFCGIGVLWDQAGNDLYLAGKGAQGAAFFGAGLLLDEKGADLYTAAQFAQAFGGSRGWGLLYDRRGNDRYLADHQFPSSYGTAGVFKGWAQGVGCGFRGFSSGGIGLLLDKAGDDDYQAGNFSQGTGYFFGMGLLIDEWGGDAYRGSRYAQGAAAHQAIGVLQDRDGDDSYWARTAASQGAAWDAAVGILEDRNGDDRYRGQDLSQGAAAMNGLGLLYDWRGNDRYQTHSGQGLGSSASYWGGRDALNLGMLIDAGGQPDSYNLAGKEDHTTSQSPGIGLFQDR